MKDQENVVEETEVEGTPKLSQSEQLRKYKGGYTTYQAPNGSLSMDNNDEVALLLRGSSPETVMRAAEKLRVLIAEDGLLDSQAMVAGIEHLGHQVVGTAPDGEKAVEMATSLRPDVVLMDIQMPVLDGIEACRLIQESCPLPVVIMTEHDSKEFVQRASAAGVGAYLVKPPDARAMDQAITVSRARFEDLMQLRKLNGELQKIVTELEAANQELEAFSHALAHDLKNPMLIVTHFSQELRETLGDSLGEQEADDLQRIRAAGRHMMHIVDDLRDLADVNRAELSREEVQLSTLGQDIIDDLRALVPDRDVRFEAEPGIKALGDKTLLRILLTNLLQNAWKYTGPSDDAWIELGVAEDESDGPTYHVRDNGIGFDNADSEKIFRAFERLHTRWEFAGSGLGLATVERIVRRHGGRVWGEGIPGEGAVFRFTLGSPSTGHNNKE